MAVRSGVTLLVVGALVAMLASTPATRWEWHRIWGSDRWSTYLLGGLLTTAWISAASMVLGLLLGLLGGLARLSRRVAVHQLGTLYVELVRGTPLLVQILVAYYCFAPAAAAGLRSVGLVAAAERVQDPFVVGILALGTFSGAYVSEIVRAAVQSIDPGQREAALAQGLSRGQVMRLVLLPQALPRMLPPLTGEFVNLVKDSSLLMLIAVTELTRRAYDAYSTEYLTFEVFLPLAVLYLAITLPLSRLTQRLERRWA